MSTQNYEANKQWKSRPDDQRFETVALLQKYVEARTKRTSWFDTDNKRVQLMAQGDDVIYAQTEKGLVDFTHWSFGQLCQSADHAPAGYLRNLPAPLAAMNLQWGLEHGERESNKFLVMKTNGLDPAHEEQSRLRAITSTTYGRIWDADVVKQIVRINQDGRWQVPTSSYSAKDPKRATTLYASDHDCFMFLVDPKNPIQVAGETLFRGFIVWNSEVGAATFGLNLFLYRTVCDNRIIWGYHNIGELKIKHTHFAPERFVREGSSALKELSEASTKTIETQIKAVKQLEVAKDDDSAVDWLKRRGFEPGTAKNAVMFAKAEEGRAVSAWDLLNGLTAYARTIQHTDQRVSLERRAGTIMDTVRGNA